LATLSRLSNWPLAGLYHRADMMNVGQCGCERPAENVAVERWQG
jgi:hypothetical protein